MDWGYQSDDPNEDCLLENILIKSKKQEQPVLPCIAALLVSNDSEAELDLHVTPSQSTEPYTYTMDDSFAISDVPIIPKVATLLENCTPLHSPSQSDIQISGSSLFSTDSVACESAQSDPLQSLGQPFFTDPHHDSLYCQESILDSPKEHDSYTESMTSSDMSPKALQSLTQLSCTPSDSGEESDSSGFLLDSQGYFKDYNKKPKQYKMHKKCESIRNKPMSGGTNEDPQLYSKQNFHEKELSQSILDSQGYFREAPKKVNKYKQGRNTIILGNNDTKQHMFNSESRKRKSNVDISALLDEHLDKDSAEWTSSLESIPTRFRERSPDLFDDSD